MVVGSLSPLLFSSTWVKSMPIYISVGIILIILFVSFLGKKGASEAKFLSP